MSFWFSSPLRGHLFEQFRCPRTKRISLFSALMPGTAKDEHAQSEEAQSAEPMAHSAEEEERQKA